MWYTLCRIHILKRDLNIVILRYSIKIFFRIFKHKMKSETRKTIEMKEYLCAEYVKTIRKSNVAYIKFCPLQIVTE